LGRVPNEDAGVRLWDGTDADLTEVGKVVVRTIHYTVERKLEYSTEVHIFTAPG